MKTLPLDTIAQIRAQLITTVSTLLEHNGQAFYEWQSNRLGNDLFISDPERAERIHEAAQDGADGSTHREHIADFQEYADEHYRELERACFNLSTDSENPADVASFEAECKALEMEIESAQEALDADMERLEQWHQDNGTLDEQIG